MPLTLALSGNPLLPRMQRVMGRGESHKGILEVRPRPQTVELGRQHALVLDQDLVRGTHAVGPEQLSHRGHLGRLRIQAGEGRFDPQADQEVQLVREAGDLQAYVLPGQGQAREVHMRRQVLLTDANVWRVGHGVPVIAEQRAGLSRRREEIGGGVAVVDGHDEAAAQARAGLPHPLERLQIDLRLLADLQADSETRKIGFQGRGAERRLDFDETATYSGRHGRLPSYEDFPQAQWPFDHAVHGERVHQFVGEKHARDRVNRYRVQVRYPGDAQTRVREFAQALFLRFDHGWAPFHQEVP